MIGAAGPARRAGALAHRQSLRYAEELRRLHRDLERAITQSLFGLAAALEAKDPYTRGHSDRVAAGGRRLAQALGLPRAEVESIARAGLLHDLGKIGVPEAVLGRRGPLSAEDWEHMRRHPVVGARIVAPLDVFAGSAAAIRHHHERWDGRGYPDGLAGSAIPLGARVVAAADVWDALTSDRPYRRALAPPAALAALVAAAGQALDPEVVAALVGVLRADGLLGA